METHPLARKRVLVYGLRGERMPEDVAAVFLVWFEDVAVPQFSQRGVECRGSHGAHASQQAIVDPRATDGCDPEHLSGRGRERRGASEQDVLQSLR